MRVAAALFALFVLGSPAWAEAPVSIAHDDLQARRIQIDAASAELDAKQAILDAANAKLDEREKTLAALQGTVQSMIDGPNAIPKEELDRLVGLYSSMKPAAAALDLEGLPDSVLVPLAHAMDARKMSAIMAKMSTGASANLTARLSVQTNMAFAQ